MTHSSLFDENVKINRKLINVLDELLAAGDWEMSLFLRNASKQIRSLRDEAQELLIQATGSTATVAQQKQQVAAKAGHCKVYVSLYQADCNNMQKWQTTLKSLSEFSASRSTYESEEHVQAMIRAKPDAMREAYAVIFVAEKEMMPMQNQQDRLGNPLVALKMGAIKLENIVEFVHCQKRYVVYEGNLVLSSHV